MKKLLVILVIVFSVNLHAGKVDGLLIRFENTCFSLDNCIVGRADFGFVYVYPIQVSYIAYFGHWNNVDLIIFEGSALPPWSAIKRVKTINKTTKLHQLIFTAMADGGNYGCEITMGSTQRKYIGTDNDELGPGLYGFTITVRGSDLDQIIEAINVFLNEGEFCVDSVRFEKMNDPAVFEGAKEILDVLRAEREKEAVKQQQP